MENKIKLYFDEIFSKIFKSFSFSDYSECYTYQFEGLGKLGHRDLNKYWGGEGRNAALPHFFPHHPDFPNLNPV
ncbi:MAG: hypothetical protein ACXIUQ_13445, partial [Cecembia sp.]